VARLAAEAVDLIWHPDVKTMYPDGFATPIVPKGPAIASGRISSSESQPRSRAICVTTLNC